MRLFARISVLGLGVLIGCSRPEPTEVTQPTSTLIGFSLRFHGNGVNDIDRVKIPVDDPTNTDPGPPVDLGAEDMTIEFWLRGTRAENAAPAVTCGSNTNWIDGNIVVDRDRFNQGRKFGISLAAGRPAFGVTGDGTGTVTICATTDVLDATWHHLAFQRRRSDGRLSIYVDGRLEADGPGPGGDISYPDDGVPGNFCGGPCLASDPFLVIGAEKHDAGPAFPSFAGWIDELRLSNALRYLDEFLPSGVPFSTDARTVGLYHFDDGTGDVVTDSSQRPGGSTNGIRRFGGSPAGPEWSGETPFRPPS